MALRIVRLGRPRARDEGLRIGTVRRPPRGVPASRFASDDWYDVWYPDLSPSAELVKLGQDANTDRDWAARLPLLQSHRVNRPQDGAVHVSITSTSSSLPVLVAPPACARRGQDRRARFAARGGCPDARARPPARRALCGSRAVRARGSRRGCAAWSGRACVRSCRGPRCCRRRGETCDRSRLAGLLASSLLVSQRTVTARTRRREPS